MITLDEVRSGISDELLRIENDIHIDDLASVLSDIDATIEYVMARRKDMEYVLSLVHFYRGELYDLQGGVKRVLEATPSVPESHETSPTPLHPYDPKRARRSPPATRPPPVAPN